MFLMSIPSESQVAATTLGKKACKRNQMAFQLLQRLELIYAWGEIWGVVQTKVLKRQHNSGHRIGFRVQPTWV